MSLHYRTAHLIRYWRCLMVYLLAGVLGTESQAAENTATEGVPPDRVILYRWIEAMGGVSQIRELKSADYHCKIGFGTGMPPVDTYIRATAEGAYRYEYELPVFGRLIQAFDGQSVWQKNDELGFGPVSATVHAQNLTGIDFRAPIKVGSQFPERKVLPDETIDGRRLQVLEMNHNEGGRAKWYFDPSSGLRVRIETFSGSESVSIEFSDFRRVNGIQEPFRTIRKAGTQVLQVDVLSILYNEATDPALFAPPHAWLDDNREISRILHYNDRLTGNEALKQVNTRVTKILTETTTSGIKISGTIYQKRPNLILTEQEVPGMGREVQGFDGKIGWAWSELQGYRTMQGAELQQMLGNADIDGPRRLRELCPLRKLIGVREENGRRIVGIALASLQGPAGKFYFDAETFYLVRMETNVQAGASGQLKVVADFSDFREVDGVKIPFVTVVNNPAMRMVTTIESVKQNVSLEDRLFEPRKNE